MKERSRLETLTVLVWIYFLSFITFSQMKTITIETFCFVSLIVVNLVVRYPYFNFVGFVSCLSRSFETRIVV